MAEQAWRPRPCVHAHRRSGSPRVPVRPYNEGLPSQEGRYGPDEGRRKPPGSRGTKVLRSGPDETVPGWKTPQWSAGRRRASDGTRHRKVPKPKTVRRTALRSLTFVRDEGKEGAGPAPKSKGADESRLLFGCAV